MLHNCPPFVMKVNIFCLSIRWFHSDYFLTLCMREFHRFLRKNLKKSLKNHVCSELTLAFPLDYVTNWGRCNRTCVIDSNVKNFVKLIETFGQKIILALDKWPKNSVIKLSVSLNKYLSILTYLRTKIKKICSIQMDGDNSSRQRTNSSV